MPVPDLEFAAITADCRTNRGDDGAWDEAVARLREVYDAQLARHRAATFTIAIRREPYVGLPKAVVEALEADSGEAAP